MNGWSDWWRSAGAVPRWGPLVAAVLYGGIAASLGILASEQIVLVALPVGLHYLGPRLHLLRDLALLLVVTLTVNDSQKLWIEELRGPIHVGDLYAAELAWFGVGEGDERVILGRWWQTRTHPALDVIAGVLFSVSIASASSRLTAQRGEVAL